MKVIVAVIALGIGLSAFAAPPPKAAPLKAKAAAAKEAPKEEKKEPEKKEPEKKEPAAEDAKDEAEKPPAVVKIAVYVLNIGKFDLVTGSYTVDFYLDMTSVPPEADMGDPKFEFVNGRAASTDKLIDKPGERFYRIQANLQTNVDMHRFPFDKHELPIIIEPANRGKKELQYTVDAKQSGIDPAVTFVGWNLHGYDTEVRDHNYEVYGEAYSQYVYKLNISRIYTISSIKTFLPIFCFVVISLISLLVALDKLDSRVALNTAMLLASVLYHNAISSQLPPAGYLTIADKVMMATYGTIALNLGITVQLMRMMQQKRDEEAKKMRALSFKLVPAAAILGFILAAVTSIGG